MNGRGLNIIMISGADLSQDSILLIIEFTWFEHITIMTHFELLATTRPNRQCVGCFGDLLCIIGRSKVGKRLKVMKEVWISQPDISCLGNDIFLV